MAARTIRFVRTVAGLVFRRPLLSVSVVGRDAAGRILLARRADNRLWSLPGGLVDWGEQLESCARRELAEETGMRLVAIERLVGAYSDPLRDPRVHAIALAVLARVEGAPRARDPLEITEARLFERSEIDFDALSHDHGRQLADALDGRTTLG